MDATKIMIIANGKFVTNDIKSIELHNGKWKVVYSRSDKSYNYGYNNIKCLKNPTAIDPRTVVIKTRKGLLTRIASIYHFTDGESDYYHIVDKNGKPKSYLGRDLKIENSVLADTDAKKVFSYLAKIAAFINPKEYTYETQNLATDGTDGNYNFLAQQYNGIEGIATTRVSSIYLNPNRYMPQEMTSKAATIKVAPIFPFGCNESQYLAVTRALENRISIIEGPPGTGKTQTILNIIANIVMQGKTVQVVSNNNSAIDNVLEKLSAPEYKLDFIVARLGKKARRQEFIENQTGEYPLEVYRALSPEKIVNIRKQVLRNNLLELRRLFAKQNELARLRAERRELELEREHHEKVAPIQRIKIFGKVLPAEKVMRFWQEYNSIKAREKKAGLLYRICAWFRYRLDVKKILALDASIVEGSIERLYYDLMLDRTVAMIDELEQELATKNIPALLKSGKDDSMLLLREKIRAKYCQREKREKFSLPPKELDKFLAEYPVVLSTTYTARSSLGGEAEFDYVIMDESSQVDVATGLLALSTAKNAVIVGDTKQLPNIVPTKDKIELQEIFVNYGIDRSYNYVEYSFLESLESLLGDKLPVTTLCEHYRCNPAIIGFCNRKFYDNKLIVMTNGDGKKSLELRTTSDGYHARRQGNSKLNQRQSDIICKEIIPNLNCRPEDVGIIVPYREQVHTIKKDLGTLAIDVASIHRFQGREKDVIIFSTVDDVVSEFSDDPTLINVAVSRAKKKLILVAGGYEQPVGSNVGDLIGYMRYNNCEESTSAISSVFDYLYREYAAARREYLKRHKKISQYDSENLMYATIEDVLKECDDVNLGIVCHQQLNLLFLDTTRLTAEESRFVNTGLSHLDFLIYNQVSKMPLLAVEVDGFSYHQANEKQQRRDALKNSILAKYNLPLLRFATNGSNEAEKLQRKLAEIITR